RECFDYPMDVRDLPRQRVRHRWPVCLVLLELRVPEGGPLLVERHGEVLGAALADDLLQHRGEPVDCIRRTPRCGGGIGKRKEDTITYGDGEWFIHIDVDQDRTMIIRTESHNGKETKNQPEIVERPMSNAEVDRIINDWVSGIKSTLKP